MDKRNCAYEVILGVCEDKSNVYVLPPSKGTLDGRHVCHQDMMGVPNFGVVNFIRLLQEGWGPEVVDDGYD